MPFVISVHGRNFNKFGIIVTGYEYDELKCSSTAAATSFWIPYYQRGLKTLLCDYLHIQVKLLFYVHILLNGAFGDALLKSVIPLCRC